MLGSEELRRALHVIIPRLTFPPAKQELAHAERVLGRRLPEALERLLAVTDGARAQVATILPLGRGVPVLGGEAGVLDVWAWHRDHHADAGPGWIGCDVVPVADLGDGEQLVARWDGPGLFVHDPERGAAREAEWPDLDGWMMALVREHVAMRLRMHDELPDDLIDEVLGGGLAVLEAAARALAGRLHGRVSEAGLARELEAALRQA